MGTGQQQISPPSEASTGPNNGVTTVSDESRNLKEKLPKGGLKKESGPQRQVSDDSRNPKRSFRNHNQAPSTRSFFLSKSNSDLKWERAKMVVGALEVKSDPFLQPKEDMKPLYRNDEDAARATKFEDALQAWEDLNLRLSFTKACTDLPDFVCCCGLSQSDNASMIKQYVVLLNDGWVKHANSKLKTRGFKIDAFLWDWQNTSGKTSKNILLIRFFELSTYKFRRASQEGSLDLDDMLLGDPEGKGGNKDNSNDDSSHYSASHNSGEDSPDL